MTAYATRPLAVTGAVITAADTNISRSNEIHFNELCPVPTNSAQLLRSSSTSAASFVDDGAGSGIDADQLDGQEGAYYASAASVTALAGVPTGLIAAFATAGAIASGWTRYTSADGRMLVGAGTLFSVIYAENTNYGSAWSHFHGITHTHAYSGNTGDAINGHTHDADDYGTRLIDRDQGHDHDFSGTTANNVAVSPDNANGATNSGSATWVIPSRGVVWAQKS